jgi:hypothetical protein
MPSAMSRPPASLASVTVVASGRSNPSIASAGRVKPKVPTPIPILAQAIASAALLARGSISAVVGKRRAGDQGADPDS